MSLRRQEVEAYLHRLGLPDAMGPPSVAGLRALQTAHTAQIPYETIGIALGRHTEMRHGAANSALPGDSARALATTAYGGYCFILNGGFSALLGALGYQVHLHRGGVQRHGAPSPAEPSVAGHLALTVHGLPDQQSPDGRWFVDVGLGDVLSGPLPLRAGTYRQGPLHLTLSPSSVVEGGWHLTHDPHGSFAAHRNRGCRSGLKPPASSRLRAM